jgi:dTDP-D-glucose 4,6-dehydratase
MSDIFFRESGRAAMKRVLVTGGAGFIGSHLCDGLTRTIEYFRSHLGDLLK